MNIEGLKFHFTTTEVANLLDGRIKHHQGRCRFYEEEIKRFKDSGIIVTDNYGSYNNNPIGSMESKLKEHQAKADAFNFMARHLVPNATYILSEADLRHNLEQF